MSILNLNMVPIPSFKAAPRIKSIHPVGSNILIELLNKQELTSNKIIVADDAAAEGPPQAYVLEVGPAIVSPEIRSLEGKRIVVNGMHGTNLPVCDAYSQMGRNRIQLMIEYSMIKAVLEEEGTFDENDEPMSISSSKCCCQ